MSSNEAPSAISNNPSNIAIEDDNFRLHLSDDEDKGGRINNNYADVVKKEEIPPSMITNPPKNEDLEKKEELKQSTNQDVAIKDDPEDAILDKYNLDELTEENIDEKMELELLNTSNEIAEVSKEKGDVDDDDESSIVNNTTDETLNNAKKGTVDNTVEKREKNEMLKDQVMDTENLLEVVPKDVEEINDKYSSNTNSPQPSDKAESESNDMDVDAEKESDQLEDDCDDTAKNDNCEQDTDIEKGGPLKDENNSSGATNRIKSEDDVDIEENPLRDESNIELDKEYAAIIKNEIKKDAETKNGDESLEEKDDDLSDYAARDASTNNDNDDELSSSLIDNDALSTDLVKGNKDKLYNDNHANMQPTKRPLNDCDQTSEAKKLKLQEETKNKEQDQIEKTSIDNIDKEVKKNATTNNMVSKYMKEKSLNNLSRNDLEQLILQKIFEEIGHKSEINELKQQLGLREQTTEMWRKETSQLTKQARDLEIVNRRLLHEIRLKTDREKPLMPVKITRSVGLQVRSDSNMVNKTLGANKQAVKSLPVTRPPTTKLRTLTTNTFNNSISPTKKLLETNKIIIPTLNKFVTPAANKAVTSTKNKTATATVNKVATPAANKVATPAANNVTAPATLNTSLSTSNKVVTSAQNKSALNIVNKSASNTVIKASTAVINSNITAATNKTSPSVGGATVHRKIVSVKSPSSLLSKVLQISTNNSVTAVSTPPITVISSHNNIPTTTLTPISLINSNKNLTIPTLKTYMKPHNPKNVIDLTDDDDNNRTTAPVILATTTAPPPLVPQSVRMVSTQIKPTATLVQSNSNSSTRIMYLCTSNPSQPVPQKLMLLNPAQTSGILATVCSNQPSPINLNASIAAMKTTPAIAISQPAYKHPAPLPSPPPSQSYITAKKPIPPKPHLSIRRSEKGIVLSWKMPYILDDYMPVASYQLYAYQEVPTPPVSELWRKIGDVKALALPMACTLTQFADGNKYYFAVRAVDTHKRMGPFSEPQEIHL